MPRYTLLLDIGGSYIASSHNGELSNYDGLFYCGYIFVSAGHITCYHITQCQKKQIQVVIQLECVCTNMFRLIEREEEHELSHGRDVMPLFKLWYNQLITDT